MPKANKHAEVKPSKFKTTLCNFFVKGEECPFGAKCAFAHGEHELQTEQHNIQVLKETGLRRLDGVEGPVKAATPTSVNSASLSDSISAPPTPNSPANISFSASSTKIRRRPVMVSLPKDNTRSDHFQSPYEAAHSVYSYTQQSPSYSAVYARPVAPHTPAIFGPCRLQLSSTCRSEQPLTYRHNPYNISTY